MKRVFIAFTALIVSMTVFGQTDSPVFNEFISKYQELQNKYQENTGRNLKQTDLILKEMITTVENVKMSDAEISKFQPIIDKIKAGTYYNLACNYSLLNQKKQAVAAFEKSVEFGYKDYSHIKVDSDLDNIRKEKRFVDIMKQLEEKSFISILKKAGKYQTENTDSFPKFTYQSSDNYNLKNVRTTFNLDSIAGSGDEISKILNLLHWAHNTIRHDGSNIVNCEYDAIDLYNYNKATGKGINCRNLATFLNECYLSMGIPSRFITCLPQDSTDQDCHVINNVYCETLKKWIWIDPTFNAFVKDENGNFLGIAEVRERLIDGRPLVLNDDANWNNQSKQTKEDYLENYMAKNLYWLQCPADSKFNVESRYRDSQETYISLVPTGFSIFGKSYRKLASNIVTTDSNYFWQKP